MLEVAAVGELDGKGFAADGGMREVDGVRCRVAFRRINRDELSAVGEFDGLANPQILSAAPLAAQARLLNHLDKRLGAAVQDGQFQVIQLDDGVIHAHAHQRRQQVLGGRDENAFFHQAGGVADFGDVVANGFDLEAIEVGAAKQDAGAAGRGQET